MLALSMKCEHCGAVLSPQAMACSFCQAPTAAAIRARQQAEYEQHQRAQQVAMAAQLERSAGLNRLQSTSTQSMWWSIAGLVVCCMPVALVGLVQGLRARGLAKTLNAPMPGQALTGLVLSGVGSLCSIGFYIYAIISSSQQDEAAAARIKVLDAQTQVPAMAAGLTQPTACALAEAYALKTGFAGNRGPTLDHFECLGRVVPTGDKADLEDFRFRKGATAKFDVHVCFKHGARWFVTALQEAPCSGPVLPASSR